MIRVACLGVILALADETLYNGIPLPSPWPPKLDDVPKDPVTPAYLIKPPSVIPIDVGRQLFVDDFLIESTTLKRTFHLAKYHPASPVLKPDKPWEGQVAMIFSDGVWYDPKEKLFKMWYMGGYLKSTCYATSKDGIHWEKPILRDGTNIVHPGHRDSSTVWLDHEEKDPAKRFKMFRSTNKEKTWWLEGHTSPDGIQWSDVAFRSGLNGDRSTVFWNPFRKVWVYSLRSGGDPRRRRYWEVKDLSEPTWTEPPPFWIGVDSQDPMREDLKIPCQLYNLDCVAYESILLGMFTIWRGQPKWRQKPNDIVLGYSRDGWSWHRPDRRAFCSLAERQGDWNFANVQSAGGCCLVVGDELYFYVSGRAGEPGTYKTGICSTGLATLRRDGFASMGADGTLTTRPVRFSGRHLFVNAEVPYGSLSVEVLDERGRPMPELECFPIQSNLTLRRVLWKSGGDLSSLAGKPIRFRFTLRDCRLYSFWVSPDESGASRGYVGAGGPGYTGPVDTVGSIDQAIAYQVDSNWPKKRGGEWGQMPGVAVDRHDNVWIFTRAEPPVQVYDADGNHVRSWGEKAIKRSHHIRFDPEGNVWLSDIDQHVMFKFTPEGKHLLTLGTPNQPGEDDAHLNRPTDIAITAAGDLFVSDGYGNNRVAHFDKNGKFVKAWGKKGAAPGDFNLPHSIVVDSKGRLYVADRNNVRVQVFDQGGKFQDEWRNVVVPWGLWATPQDEIWVCGSSPMVGSGMVGVPPKDQVFMKFNASGKLVQLWTVPKGVDGHEQPGDCNWVHAIAVDSKGNLYVGDIQGKRAQKFTCVK